MDRVLIADDDRELCELLVEYLAGEGFRVEAVHDGASAVERLRDGDYHLLVLDVMMPRMGGFDVLRELRASSRLPVLMLTARGDDVDRIVGLEMGADDYVAKPCNPRELAARLRAILRRTREADTAVPVEPRRLSIGDVGLDAGTRTVTRAGATLDLTSTEFNVLEVLLRAAGQVLTKEALTERAMGRKLERHDRAVDMHVSNLRRKLGPGADGEPLIRTVRGVGYLYGA